jgi:hypothetical protein
MPLATNQYDEQVVGRILEMAAPATPWYRRLWHSGPLLTAGELLEVGALRGAAVSAKRDLQADLIAALRDDAGLGTHAQAIRTALPKDARDLVVGGYAWHALELATANAATGYLTRWATTLRVGPRPPAEFVARRLTAYVLDSGWSPTHLHRWLTYRAVHRTSTVDLPDILDEAAADIVSRHRVFQICVPLAQNPPLPRPTPPGWLTSREAAAWRQANVPSSKSVRQYGAVLFDIQAADVYSAADIVRSRLASLAARFAVGGRRELRFGNEIWVAGMPGSLPTEGSPRRVEVYSVEHLERLFELAFPQALASALELIEPLDRGTPAAATIGSWAAIESLLVGPADGPNTVAADRMALVVASSFIRTELTVLAWAHARASSDTLASAITAATESRDKAQLLEQAIVSHTLLNIPRISDQWAAARLAPLLQDPYTGVRSLQVVLQRVFRRLYRQRNIIAHGGRTDSIGLDSTIRLAAPLVGEGLDRISYAMLKRGVEPLRLAAGAKIRIATLKPATAAQGSGVVDLLE